jgi:hypothetical protein
VTHECKALIFRVRPKYHLIITHLKEQKTDETEAAHTTWEVKYKYFGIKTIRSRYNIFVPFVVRFPCRTSFTMRGRL